MLDASAVIALLLAEPAAGTVRSALESGHARMSTVNAAEVVDVATRQHGGDPDAVAALVDELLSTAVEPVAPSAELGVRAGELRASLYDPRIRRLSLADCFVLATAEPDARILTTDSTLAAVARDLGLHVVPLG